MARKKRKVVVMSSDEEDEEDETPMNDETAYISSYNRIISKIFKHHPGENTLSHAQFKRGVEEIYRTHNTDTMDEQMIWVHVICNRHAYENKMTSAPWEQRYPEIYLSKTHHINELPRYVPPEIKRVTDSGFTDAELDSLLAEEEKYCIPQQQQEPPSEDELEQKKKVKSKKKHIVHEIPDEDSDSDDSLGQDYNSDSSSFDSDDASTYSAKDRIRKRKREQEKNVSKSKGKNKGKGKEKEKEKTQTQKRRKNKKSKNAPSRFSDLDINDISSVDENAEDNDYVAPPPEKKFITVNMVMRKTGIDGFKDFERKVETFALTSYQYVKKEMPRLSHTVRWDFNTYEYDEDDEGSTASMITKCINRAFLSMTKKAKRNKWGTLFNPPIGHEKLLNNKQKNQGSKTNEGKNDDKKMDSIDEHEVIQILDGSSSSSENTLKASNKHNSFQSTSSLSTMGNDSSSNYNSNASQSKYSHHSSYNPPNMINNHNKENQNPQENRAWWGKVLNDMGLKDIITGKLQTKHPTADYDRIRHMVDREFDDIKSESVQAFPDRHKLTKDAKGWNVYMECNIPAMQGAARSVMNQAKYGYEL